MPFFLIQNPGFDVFLKIIGAQNQLQTTFCIDLVCKNTLKDKNSTHAHMNF